MCLLLSHLSTATNVLSIGSGLNKYLLSQIQECLFASFGSGNMIKIGVLNYWIDIKYPTLNLIKMLNV